jgi:hypothetical protein
VKDELVKKVEILLDAVRSWSGSGALDASSAIGAKLDLYNLDLWLQQAKKDPSFSAHVLKCWTDILQAHIRHSLTRFQCAKLFGRLFNEWLASGDSATAANLIESPSAMTTQDVDMTKESFVEVGRKEMHEQKERLKSLIFEPKTIDTGALTTYLNDLFSSEEAEKALEFLRGDIGKFGDSFQYKSINVQDVSWAITNLLASELMNESKRTTLREFAENPTVLDEVVSVLNMRLASLVSWSWPEAGLCMEMRRHLNGKYRAFTDPEILDALFLQYIGVSWQCQFKTILKHMFTGRGWRGAYEPLSKDMIDRRKIYLGEGAIGVGIESERQRMRETHFLVSQLHATPYSNLTYDDSLESDDANTNTDSAVSAAAIKQKHLHMLVTECDLNVTLHGRHTVVRTDLEWFGPSLPHDSIITVLAFFGVPENWLEFFSVFLKAPMCFKDDAGDIQVRERGTPISYALSALCGEIILFGMDFAVNQKADGLFLYRIHDDIWFWDPKPEKCVAAWKEMNTYASLVGLNFNASKTGSACVGADLSRELPEGDIRWGFLKFDSTQRRFIIDQPDVDAHIVELRRQLSATRSVFGWVNAYNKYMAFFVRNFGGRPAACFGREHLDDMIDTLAKVQKQLFPGDQAEEGGAVGHLRNMIRVRFGVDNLPQGYFYFPISNGGLELRNPMVEIFAMVNMVFPAKDVSFKKQVEKDYATYRNLKDRWDQSESQVYLSTKEFMPYEEYVYQRETRLASWKWSYIKMLKVPPPVNVSLSPAVEAALKNAWPDNHWRWHDSMDFYQKWVVGLYADEVIERFGSLEVVDPALIPVGLVQLFRNSRMKWDQ